MCQVSQRLNLNAPNKNYVWCKSNETVSYCSWNILTFIVFLGQHTTGTPVTANLGSSSACSFKTTLKSHREPTSKRELYMIYYIVCPNLLPCRLLVSYLYVFQQGLWVLYSLWNAFLIFRERLQLLHQCPESAQFKLGQVRPFTRRL